MDQYNQYTSEQLFEKIRSSSGSIFNYLVRLLLQKNDSKKYIEQLLGSKNNALRNQTILLFSAEDTNRYADALAHLLDTGDKETKKIIVSRLIRNTNSPIIVKALLSRVKDVHEENTIRRAAITALGNSGDNTSAVALIDEFEKFDSDGKIELLIALNKLESKEAIPLFRQALTDKHETVRYWAEKTLKHSAIDRNEFDKLFQIEQENGSLIYKTWVRDPLENPDSSHLYFSKRQQGIYEETKAGEPLLRIDFEFRIEKGEIFFVTKKKNEYRSGYVITKGLFKHHYLGNLPCFILKFNNPRVVIDEIPITATEYYHLFENK